MSIACFVTYKGSQVNWSKTQNMYKKVMQYTERFRQLGRYNIKSEIIIIQLTNCDIYPIIA